MGCASCNSAILQRSGCSLATDRLLHYVATGEPMDKAGAHAIQGLASKFMDRVEGRHFNVVGLHVAMVHLKEFQECDTQEPAFSG